MAAARNCVSNRKRCSASAAGGCSRLSGIQPDVCHLNEGHAAFAVLERARSFMEATGQPFDVALAATRAGNLFTTHTAVAAGFDRFCSALIEQYLGRYAEQKLGISAARSAGAGTREPGRRVGAFQHGLPGHAGQRRGEWREPAARASEPADSLSRFSRAGRRTKCPSAMSPTAFTCRRGTRRKPMTSGRKPAARIAGWERPENLEQDIRRSPTPSSGNFAAPPARRWLNTPAQRLPRHLPPPALRRGDRTGEACF